MFTSAVGNATSSTAAPSTSSGKSGVSEIDKLYYYQFVENIRSLMFEIEGVYLYSMKFAITKQQLILQNGFPDAWVNFENEFRPMLLPFLPVGQQFRLQEAELKEILEQRREREREIAEAQGVAKFSMRAADLDASTPTR